MRLNCGFARRRFRQIGVSLLCFGVLLAGISLVSVVVSGEWRFGALTTAGAAADNWGLSFPKPGETPQGNVSQEFLQQFGAYYIGDTSEKVIYLTFDAGYENGHTADILDVLQKHQAPAAFFLVGSYIREQPELVCRMAVEGHIVGNHTNSHPDMSAISEPQAFAAELLAVEQAYKEATGDELPKFYRPPQGKYSQSNLQQANELGYTTVFWSLAYVDWQEDAQPSREQAFGKLIPRIHNGAVVLLHSTSATNAEILDELLTKWSDMGYKFKALTDLPGFAQN